MPGRRNHAESHSSSSALLEHEERGGDSGGRCSWTGWLRSYMPHKGSVFNPVGEREPLRNFEQIDESQAPTCLLEDKLVGNV